ncbi:MAG: Teneurin-3 [Actinomycetia bacterium]|nr:Teneurin-3 [Actinomycetes bacterium]
MAVAAAPLGKGTPSLSLPDLSDVLSWVMGVPSPKWGRLPRQASGTAAGRGHSASAASTRAGRGAGHKPGKGRGELAAYTPYARAVKKGKSHSTTGFSPKTSKRMAAKSSQVSDYFQNTDGTITRKIAQTPINYRDATGWQPIDTRVAAGPGGRWREKSNSLSVDFAPTAADAALASFAVDGSHSLSYALQGAGKVTGTVSGSTVTYKGALTDTDLALSPIPTGVKESIILRSAQAPVTCMGDGGGTDGVVSREVVVRLNALIDDPILGGIAGYVLGDIRHFANES